MKINLDLRTEVLAVQPEAFRTGDPTLLRLDACGRLSVYYAPFEYVNVDASIVIVGLTPGRAQAANAVDALQRTFVSTQSWDDALREAKSFASFSGPMRANLVRMLDYIGIHEVLEIPSTGELFGASGNLVHFTSVLRNPVFVDGKNYGGNPDIASNSWLRSLASATFPDELSAIRSAPIIVPLGPKVAAALLACDSRLSGTDEQFLSGLPHPSGANSERISYFLGKKARANLSKQTNSYALDAAREELLRKTSILKARFAASNHSQKV